MGAHGNTMVSGLDSDLLDILCCPVTHQTLRTADPEELVRASVRLDEPLTEGLVREDGQVLYPIRDGIPLLVPEEGLLLT